MASTGVPADPPSESGAAASSSIDRLYTAVLGCVFSFLSLRELIDVSVTCGAWKRTVESMGSIYAAVSVPPLTPLEHIAESPTLGRHVGSFRADSDSSLMRIHSSTLAVLAERMPQLQSLACHVFPALESELRFPRGLRDATVNFPPSVGVLGVHAGLRGLARLPRLTNLTVTLHRCRSSSDVRSVAGLDLLPLASMSALRRLSIHCDRSIVWSQEQIDVFRSLGALEYFCLDNLASCLAELVRSPHSLAWTEVADQRTGQLVVTESVAALLPALPSLASLNVNSRSSLDYLSGLPRLRSLSLQFDYPRPELAMLLRCLSTCAELTAFSIDDSNAEADFFEELLPSLPKLQSLSLSSLPNLSSLSFLRHPALAASLRSLSLSRAALHPQELFQLSALKRLEWLHIHKSATRLAPSPDHLRQLHPPSELLPSLRHFEWI